MTYVENGCHIKDQQLEQLHSQILGEASGPADITLALPYSPSSTATGQNSDTMSDSWSALQMTRKQFGWARRSCPHSLHPRLLKSTRSLTTSLSRLRRSQFSVVTPSASCPWEHKLFGTIGRLNTTHKCFFNCFKLNCFIYEGRGCVICSVSYMTTRLLHWFLHPSGLLSTFLTLRIRLVMQHSIFYFEKKNTCIAIFSWLLRSRRAEGVIGRLRVSTIHFCELRCSFHDVFAEIYVSNGNKTSHQRQKQHAEEAHRRESNQRPPLAKQISTTAPLRPTATGRNSLRRSILQF